MRIGLFTDAYLPQISGVASSTALLQQALKDMGHLAFVITPSDPGQPADETDVFRVPSLPFISSKRLSFGIHPVLAKQLKSLDLDIVHSQTEFGMGLYARQIAEQLDIPHVHTFHTLYEDWLNDQVKAKKGGLYQRLTAWYVKRSTRRYCNRVDFVIVPTQKTKDVLLKYGVTTQLEIIPTGINLSSFRNARFDTDHAEDIRRSLGLDAADKMLLYVGRVSREKHIDELITLLKDLLTERRDIHFVVVGDGPAKNELVNYASELGIADRVHFTGAIPWRNVPSYYAAADFFLSASQSETQGLTYIEAMAAGVPLLVREDPCLEDVVINGVNGYAYTDETSFAETIELLLNLNEDEYKQFSDGAFESSEYYSVSHFARSVASVYETLIGEVE